MVDAVEAKKKFQYSYPYLIEALPIDDLLPEFFAKGLLEGQSKSKLESRTTRQEKTQYFLDEMIKPSLTTGLIQPFNNMITIMESSELSVAKHLAKQIKEFDSGTYAL